MPITQNPIADMYQSYWDAYGQIAAETLLFTTKISTIALAATQRSMNLNLQASRPAAAEGATEARVPSFLFPGMPLTASGMQDQMMRNAAEWQKQMTGYFQQYLKQTGIGAGTAH